MGFQLRRHPEPSALWITRRPGDARAPPARERWQGAPPGKGFSRTIFALQSSRSAKTPLSHQRSDRINSRIRTTSEGSDHILPLSLGAILAELEFGFHTSGDYFEADNVLQHSFAVLLTERRPLPGISRIKTRNHFQQQLIELSFVGEHCPASINVNRSVVPGGHAFANLIQAWRNVRVGTMENY